MAVLVFVGDRSSAAAAAARCHTYPQVVYEADDAQRGRVRAEYAALPARVPLDRRPAASPRYGGEKDSRAGGAVDGTRRVLEAYPRSLLPFGPRSARIAAAVRELLPPDPTQPVGAGACPDNARIANKHRKTHTPRTRAAQPSSA